MENIQKERNMFLNLYFWWGPWISFFFFHSRDWLIQVICANRKDNENFFAWNCW